MNIAMFIYEIIDLSLFKYSLLYSTPYIANNEHTVIAKIGVTALGDTHGDMDMVNPATNIDKIKVIIYLIACLYLAK
jgi:hypothetical protein